MINSDCSRSPFSRQQARSFCGTRLQPRSTRSTHNWTSRSNVMASKYDHPALYSNDDAVGSKHGQQQQQYTAGCMPQPSPQMQQHQCIFDNYSRALTEQHRACQPRACLDALHRFVAAAKQQQCTSALIAACDLNYRSSQDAGYTA